MTTPIRHFRELDDGGLMVFCEFSGETHRLDPISTCVLDAVHEGGQTDEALAQRIAAEFDVALSDAAEHASEAVRGLLRVGLLSEGSA